MPGYNTPYNPATGNVPLGNTTSDIDKNNIRNAQSEYSGLSPQFGNIALQGANSNPAQGMFDPSWYGGDQNTINNSLGNAYGEQGALDNEANAYDQMSGQFNDFANGVDAQLQPGMNAQDQNANEQESQAQQLWANPGYTQAEKTAQTVGAQTPIAASYTSAAGDMRNNAARTGNSAALGASEADLARKKAQDMGMAGLNAQAGFANARIAGQQFANQATGQAGQARSNANQTRQAGANLESNIRNTGANIAQGGANIRIGAAGSANQTANTANANQNTMQGAQALSMAPYQLAANMYGTVNGARNAAGTNQTAIVTNANNNSLGTQASRGLGTGIGGFLS